MQRLSWKNALLAERTAHYTTLLTNSSLQDTSKNAYCQVHLQGVFQHAQEEHLLGRTQQGELGVHVLTPLILPNGTQVLVDRGWSARKKLSSFSRPLGQVSLSGVCLPAFKPSFWTPKNDAQKHSWYWVDLSSLMPYGVQTFYILATQENGRVMRSADKMLPTVPNNHLQYALTWGLLAVCLFVFGFYKNHFSS